MSGSDTLQLWAWTTNHSTGGVATIPEETHVTEAESLVRYTDGRDRVGLDTRSHRPERRRLADPVRIRGRNRERVLDAVGQRVPWVHSVGEVRRRIHESRVIEGREHTVRVNARTIDRIIENGIISYIEPEELKGRVQRPRTHQYNGRGGHRHGFYESRG